MHVSTSSHQASSKRYPRINTCPAWITKSSLCNKPSFLRLGKNIFLSSFSFQIHVIYALPTKQKAPFHKYKTCCKITTYWALRFSSLKTINTVQLLLLLLLLIIIIIIMWQNSPLLDNGWLERASALPRRDWFLETNWLRITFPWIGKLKVVNAWKPDRCCEIDTRFVATDKHRITVIHELFQVVVSLRFARSYKREFIRKLKDWFVSEFNHSKFVRELSVQLWSVNQRTTEAEQVTDS
jgi:hypothetical protein